MSGRSKVLIGIPMRRIDDVECIREIVRWASEDDDRHYIRFCISTPYGIDYARSQLIEAAMRWGADDLIMVDSDITPAVPFGPALSYAHQAFSRGYGMVISPTISSDAKLLVQPPEGHYTTPRDIHDGLSEIGWGGLGLAYFDGGILHQLAVLGYQLAVNGPEGGEPLYCTYSGKEGEDMTLCRNVRDSTGRKVGVDTRIATDHWKLKRQRSWPGTETADAIAISHGMKPPT